MSSAVLSAVILLACALAFSAAQTSCKSRCGAEYYRGYMCQCDYNCLSYGECCKDFESQCTTKNSCRGRCGEDFKRGRLCTCDPKCNDYKQCCPDHKTHCDAEEEIGSAASATAPVKTDSCNNVNGNKPEEPTVNDATEPSTFSKGQDPDINGEILPNEDSSNNEVGDPEEIPFPESTSDPADLLDPIPTEPIEDPDTLEVPTETFTASSQAQTTVSDKEPTQAEDGSASPSPTAVEASTESTAKPTAVEMAGQEEVLPEDDNPAEVLTEAPSDEPEETSLSKTTVAPISTEPTQASDGPDDSQVTTLSASMPDPTPIPEVTPANKLDDADQDTASVTTGPASLNVTPEPTKPTPSEVTSKRQDEPDPIPADPTPAEPTPAEPTPAKPTPAEPTPAKPTPAEPTPAKPTPADPTPAEPTPAKPTPAEPTPAEPTPAKPTPAKPSSKAETKPLTPAQTVNTDNPRDYQADDSNDTDLCSGRPVGAVTTLKNGTMVVFRGHYFWSLDKYMVPSPARVITQVWGVPSPIDTAFTRCNCQGKTYIFKGSQYWRFENDVLEPNYPKAITTGFDGLRGQITAALSVPQYQRRRESVFFFKRGGSVQKYSYKFGLSSSCGRKVQSPVYTIHSRMVRSAASHLEPAVNIRTAWRGFPSTITAAVSVPSRRDPEGYKYYVLSRSTSYNVRISSNRPIVPAPATNAPPQSNDFLKCPKRA
uniref:Proteoglycan 4b n=1 Tax=Gasterosteus aculeatus aculeatus TaxID=481459 RepID=A0AAQ4P6H2_GASAC|nr:proteoglycan 4b isoform X1 [Gasterosteus aculeatus aculeatus]